MYTSYITLDKYSFLHLSHYKQVSGCTTTRRLKLRNPSNNYQNDVRLYTQLCGQASTAGASSLPTAWGKVYLFLLT